MTQMHERGAVAGGQPAHVRWDGTPPTPSWFALLFALAVGAHVIGNPPIESTVLRVATGVLSVAALTLIWRPSSRAVWALVVVLVPVTTWLEAPVVGNHWLLMAAFAVAVGVGLARGRPWPWLATTLRLMFVAFYAWAAFAKLNTAFLDPAVSCAVFYANEGLRSWGLGVLPESGATVALPVLTMLVELSVPALLLVPRTRALGVAVAATFHYLISLDIGQHFYDFTAVIFVGLAVFAHDDVVDAVSSWFRRRRATAAVLTGAWALLLASAVLPFGRAGLFAARFGVLVLWIPLGAAFVWLALRGVRRPASVGLRPAGVAAVVLVTVVVVNGVLPYLGVKTATGWNMYANLVTTGGHANHLIVPAQADVVGADHVRVTAASDDRLRGYVDSDWAVPERNLRHHLVSRPDAVVTFERVDGTIVSGSGRELGRPMPEIVRRLLPLRSVDRSDPARCQAVWLPAL